MGSTPPDPSGARTGDPEGTVAPVDSSQCTTSGESLRGHARPVRTCIGCRERASSSDLVRLVVKGDGTASSVVPDPNHRASGRGAHLHPTTRCLDLAVRRRAFARAFRHSGPLDTAAVRDWLEHSSTAVPARHDLADPQRDPQPAPAGAGSDAETEHQLMSPR